MKLALIFNKERPGTMGQYFERACDVLGIAYDHWCLREVRQIPSTYDLYLRCDHGDDYEVLLPEHLRPSAFYVVDTHLAHSWRKIRRIAKRYDAIFCCHREAVEQLPRAEWLPLGCDLEYHRAVKAPVSWDVAFVGTDGAVPRKFYLQALRERYPNSFIGQADYRQIGSIYSRARIGFNYAIARDVNMRTFEILCANTLLVTDATTQDDMRRLGFEDRQQVVFYRNPQELFTVIDYFLARADERLAIAQAGGATARSHHTYAHRLRQLLVSVAERLGISRLYIPQGAETCASS